MCVRACVKEFKHLSYCEFHLIAVSLLRQEQVLGVWQEQVLGVREGSNCTRLQKIYKYLWRRSWLL